MKKILLHNAFILFLLIFPLYGKAQNPIKNIDNLSTSIEVKEASASEASDAYIKLKIIGGKAPYTIHCFSPYSIPTQSNGNELNLENIKSGDYLFVIQDSNGKAITKEIKISINR